MNFLSGWFHASSYELQLYMTSLNAPSLLTWTSLEIITLRLIRDNPNNITYTIFLTQFLGNIFLILAIYEVNFVI